MKNEVIGQNKIKDLFLKALSGSRLGHCYVFAGEPGMGKSTMTSYISKMIVCENKNACGVCKACVMADAGSHPDILHIVPQEGKQSIAVDVMRSMVEDIYVRPYMADKKVYVINGFEKAQVQAQNAVLKALEEPPEYVVFLLTISSEKDILETVKSRSLMLKMAPYTPQEVKEALSGEISSEDAEFIAALSGGNIGKGKRLAMSEEFKDIRHKVEEALCELIDGGRIMPFADIVKKENAANITDIFECTLSFLRDILMIKFKMEDLVINKDYAYKIKNLAGKVQAKNIIAVMQDIIDAQGYLKRNINYNLAVMNVVFGSMEEIND